MTPSFSLARWESPWIEITSSEFECLLSIFMEKHYPIDIDDKHTIWTLVNLDAIYLKEDSISFFSKFEEICREVLSGETSQYNIDGIQIFEISEYISRIPLKGRVTSKVKICAKQFLDLLSENPKYWPFNPENNVD